MNNTIFTIMKKELARFFGDRRMMLTTILLPGLMIYVMYNFMGSAMTSQFSVEEDYVSSVYVQNCPESFNRIIDADHFKLIEVKDEKMLSDSKKKIQDQTADISMVFPADFEKEVAAYDISSGEAAPQVQIYYNSASSHSESTYKSLIELLTGYESSMANKFDVNSAEEKYDLASEKDTTGSVFAYMLPMLLLVFLYSGCIAVAPESIAGEKERGTIASLLITPAKRGHIAIGKITALSIIALLSGASSTLGTVLSLPKLMGGKSDSISGNVYTVTDYVILGIVILSTVLVLVTLISIISAFAKSIKEAQTYVTPLMIVVLLVGITGMFGSGAKEGMAYYLIPLYNSVQNMVSIFSFDINVPNLICNILSNMVITGLGVFVLTKMFNSEKVMFNR